MTFLHHQPVAATKLFYSTSLWLPEGSLLSSGSALHQNNNLILFFFNLDGMGYLFLVSLPFFLDDIICRFLFTDLTVDRSQIESMPSRSVLVHLGMFLFK